MNGIVLPDRSCDRTLANEFVAFYESKIETIVTSFDSDRSVPDSVCHPDSNIASSVPVFDEFVPLDDEHVLKLRQVKCSVLDPLPLSLYSCIFPSIVPFYRQVLNQSLRSGIFPDSLKLASITPLLKKPDLDKNSLKSYRPVSNLSFISKLYETAVTRQLMAHFNRHNLLDSHQSAYRKYHSVETTLMQVSSSALQHLDAGRAVFLVLLDLSAAFDTLEHTTLLHVLHDEFGISGTALSWLESYLRDRSFLVRIGSECSDRRPLRQGVPQGSVLGPILFNCFMSNLMRELRRLDVEVHSYADDTQIWIAFDPRSPSAESIARVKLTAALDFTVAWMKRRRLKLNCDKTVFLPIHRTDRIFDPIICDSCIIVPSTCAKNLGVIFDTRLDFTAHISSVRKTCFYHLRRLQCLRYLLTPDHLALLVHAFITSRLDFCNSLFSGITSKNYDRLQSVQSATAKFLTGAKKFDSVSVQLERLHWLPVRKRVLFKLCLVGFHVFYSTLGYPLYVQSLKQTSNVRRSSRLGSSSLIHSSFKPRLKTCGDRCFMASVTRCFNLLPSEIRNVSSFEAFKKQTKTYIFTLM